MDDDDIKAAIDAATLSTPSKADARADAPAAGGGVASGSKPPARPVLLGKPAPMQLDFEDKDGDKDEKYVLRSDLDELFDETRQETIEVVRKASEGVREGLFA